MNLLTRHPLRTLVLMGLIVQVLVTTAGAAVIFRAILVTRQTSERVARTSEVRNAADRMLESFVDAQAGERAFLLTGNERFLAGYTDALTAVPQTAVRLADLLGGDTVQVGRVRRLVSLYTQWCDQAARSEIAARRAAPAGYAEAARGAAAEAARLRQTAAAYAASGGEDSLRVVRAQAASLRDHLTGMLRTTPPASPAATDWARAQRLLDVMAVARPASAPAPLLTAATVVEAIVRRHALAAGAAESRVMTLITRRSGQVFADNFRPVYVAFGVTEDARLAAQVAQGRTATRTAEGAALAIPVTVVLLVLLGFSHAGAATDAIDRIIEASRGIADGDLSRRVAVRRGDEIGQLATAFNEMAEQMATRARQSALVQQMSEMLEASPSVDEALSVASRYVQDLFPGTVGGVYLIADSRDAAELAASWGAAFALPPAFAPDDCWALLRGLPYAVDVQRGGVLCRHLPTQRPAANLCLPLTSQDGTLGILQLSFPAAPAGDVAAPSSAALDSALALARSISDRVGLAIANLRLRESLRAQSIRDPLTGVFNRRYLEETLEREIRRAQRGENPLGLIIFDLDRFKQFNDTYGHEAGDTFLRELGAMLRDRFRRDDVVCRYGGEEFVVVLPDATLESTLQRARSLGEAVRDLAVSYQGQPLGATTASLGVAAFPQHGASGEALLRAADAALYRAKQNGRARAEAATTPI